MPYYKLTNQDMQTHGGFQWELDKWYEIPRPRRYNGGLCSNSWFHCYNHPLLAVIFNQIHANIKNPRLFQVSVKGKKLSDNEVKFGFPYVKLIKELPLPEITSTQKIAFGILCSKEVHTDRKWNEWADNWLSGKDRSKAAAYAAAAADAYVPGVTYASYAAYAAAYTDVAVAYVVAAAAAAADAAAAAAAADAADAAGAAGAAFLDLIGLIKQAMEYK